MDKNEANEFWEKIFGTAEEAYDYASRKMKKEDFQNPTSPYGWDVEPVRPLSLGGSENQDNLIPATLYAIAKRDGKTSFSIGNLHFEMRKGKAYKTFDLYDVTDHDAPLSLNPLDLSQDKDFHQNRRNIALGHPEQEEERLQAASFSSLPNKDFSTPIINDMNETTSFAAPKEVTLEEIQKEQEEGEETTKETEAAETEEPAEETEATTEENTEDNTEETTEENTEATTEETAETVEETNEETVEAEPETEAVSQENSEETTEAEPEAEEASEETKEETTEAPEEEKIETETEEATEPTEDTAVVEETNEEKPEEEQREASSPVFFAVNTPTDSLPDNPKPETDDSSENAETGEEKETEEKTGEVAEEATEAADAAQGEDNMEPAVEAEEKTEEAKDNQQEAVSSEESAAPETVAEESATEEEKPVEEPSPIVEEDTEVVENVVPEEQKPSVLEEENAALKKQVEELQNQVLESNKAKEELDSKLSELQKKEEELSITLESLNEEITKEKAGENQQDGLLVSLEKEKQDLLEKNAGLEKEKADLSASYESEKNSRLVLGGQNGSLTSLLSDKENQIQEKNNQLDSLNQEKANLLAEKEALNKQLLELQQKNQGEEEKKNLDLVETEKKTEELQSLLSKKEQETADLANKAEELQKKNEGLTIENENLSAKLLEAEKEKQEQTDIVSQMGASLATLNEQKEMAEKMLEEEKDQAGGTKDAFAAKEEEKKALFEQVQDLQNQLAQANQFLSNDQKKEGEDQEDMMLLKLGMKLSKKEEIKKAFLENHIPFALDTLAKERESHPEWLSADLPDILLSPVPVNEEEETIVHLQPSIEDLGEEDVSFFRNEETTRRRDQSLFKVLYGQDSYDATDFAGRIMRYPDYGNKDSETGWSRIVLDPSKEDIGENIVLANYKSIKEFQPEGQFLSNGHNYEVVEKGDGKKILSHDTIANPYDFVSAMEVLKNTEGQNFPLLYLFVKCLSIGKDKPTEKEMQSYAALIEKTVRRICPHSFLSLYTHQNNLFITFDGTVDQAYKEAYHYAILLNSYRREMKEEGLSNAVLVLDQISVPYSFRHMSFKDLLDHDHSDKDIRAVSYDLERPLVVDSTIRRCVHIGPEILPNLILDDSTKAMLSPSRLGQGSFADAYRFQDQYMECRFIYKLK